MDQPDAPTRQNLRIRIAELLGATEVSDNSAYWPAARFPNEDKALGKRILSFVPDYPEDLNAVHDAERLLLTSDRLKEVYADNLCSQSAEDAAYHRQNPQFLVGYIELPAKDTFDLLHTPAWLRCIALDRTLSSDPIV